MRGGRVAEKPRNRALPAYEQPSGLREVREHAGLREALTVRLAWMGPDARQAVDDVIEELEAGR